MALRKENPQVGDWDYDGNCRPGTYKASSQITFSVGIFQWVPSGRGKGIKRSPVQYRIKGYMSKPQEVYDKAEKRCQELEQQNIKLYAEKKKTLHLF